MNHSKYRISGPAMISFSGGRTSAYMLWSILQAHGGTLPNDIKVAFANTGKEREETLRFVYECGARWGVQIHWLEWRDAKPCFELVGLNSASRHGEPFTALMAKKKRLPNWKERWCTEYLKVRTLHAFAASLGWSAGGYREVIGLRADEPVRILRALHNAKFRKVKGVEVERKTPRKLALPLANAHVAKDDVMNYWANQSFDLGLSPWEGNCDLCFMKGRAIRLRIIRDDPSAASWWADAEAAYTGKQGRGWFDRRDSVAGLLREVRESPELSGFLDPDDAEADFDAECGLACGGGAV